MIESSQPSLPDMARLLALVVGMALSFLVFFVTGLLNPWQGQPGFERILLLSLLVLSTLAGAMGAAAGKSRIPSHLFAPSMGGRLGIRAGLICALCAGALLTSAAVLKAGSAGSSLADKALRAEAWCVLFVSLAALLPSVLCGFVGGLMGGRLIHGGVFARSPDHPSPSLPWLRWATFLVMGLALTGLLSPFSFMGRRLAADPPPPVVRIEPVQKAPAVVEPVFHYEPPAGLKTARFHEIRPDFTKVIPEVAEDCPPALSPDGLLLAHGTRSGSRPTLVILDLHRFTRAASFTLPAFPDVLAWSEDSKSVACVLGRGRERRIWVLRLKDAQAVQLPRPPGRDVPLGAFFWWRPDQLAFVPEDEPPLCLDLGTLRLHSPPDNPATLEAWKDGPLARLPGQTGWRMDLRTLITAATPPPRRNPELPWEFSDRTVACFSHPKSPVSNGFMAVEAGEGQRFLLSPDGSKLAHLKGGRITVTFMKLHSAPEFLVELEMPLDPAQAGDGRWAGQVRERLPCLLLQAPMVNPLNQQVVGPDPGAVKTLARLVEWKGRKAVFAAETHLGEPLDGLIASTLHTWEQGVMKPWGPEEARDWWAVVKSIPGEVPDDLPETGTPRTLTLEARPGCHVVAKTRVRPRPPDPAPAPAPPAPEPEIGPEAVRAFIRAHHEKAALGDLPALAADYDAQVDFLDKGLVSREAVQAGERAHRSRWPVSGERVAGEITLTRENGGWLAAYALEFNHENASGDWQRGRAELTLRLRQSGRSPLIISQRAVLHEVKEGRAVGKPAEPVPPRQPEGVPVTVPKPCFVAVSRARDLGQVEFTDQVSFTGGITWHRTYRELSPEGKVLNTCRAVYEGNGGVLSNRQGARVYVGSQGWQRGLGAPDFVRLCERSAAALVGREFIFQFTQKGMVESSAGITFKLVK